MKYNYTKYDRYFLFQNQNYFGAYKHFSHRIGD